MAATASSTKRLVYFDLETTGLGNSHITQIGACSGDGATFSTFVLPKKPISDDAKDITKITCEDGVMKHHDKAVPFFKITAALEAFLRFLGKEPVLIIAHNSKNFDWPILREALTGCHMLDRFRAVVHGCVDTLPLFREMEPGLRNHKLVTLYSHYTGQDYSAHEALEDARALQTVVDLAKPDAQMLSKHCFAV